jgi:hypothetical protein
VHAKIAELFVSEARHVLVFFADLYGLEDLYNRPGVVDEDNWGLRLPPAYARAYESARAEGAALDLPRALALALRAVTDEASSDDRALIEDVERLAAYRLPA